MNNKHQQLIELCKKITSSGRSLPADHPLTKKLINPESNHASQEIKTYPLLHTDHLFVLCWYFEHNHLNASLLPTPSPVYYKFNIQNNIMTQSHTHDYIEMAYIVSGTFKQSISGKTITFSEGEICLIDKNCIHQDFIMPQDAVILFFGIANSMFKEIMNENVTTEKIIAFLQEALIINKDLQQFIVFHPDKNKPSAPIYMEQNIFYLITELLNHDIASDYICKGLLLRIFRCLSTQYDFALTKEQRQTMSTLIYDAVTDYIRKNYVHIRIEDLVNHFHFHEDYFNRLIKQQTGMTYSAFLQEIRLEHAQNLLLTTKMSIDHIADAVGYQNKGYFYKIFVTKNQMTPAQYRKLHTKSHSS